MAVKAHRAISGIRWNSWESRCATACWRLVVPAENVLTTGVALVWRNIPDEHITSDTRRTSMVLDGKQTRSVDVQAVQARVSDAERSHYDLLILGSGSTAFAAATRAKDLGK